MTDNCISVLFVNEKMKHAKGCYPTPSPTAIMVIHKQRRQKAFWALLLQTSDQKQNVSAAFPKAKHAIPVSMDTKARIPVCFVNSGNANKNTCSSQVLSEDKAEKILQ